MNFTIVENAPAELQKEILKQLNVNKTDVFLSDPQKSRDALARAIDKYSHKNIEKELPKEAKSTKEKEPPKKSS